ncbi:MAG: tRNA lysidine(34) synthetase TilS [Bacteroidia bacterium]
MLEVFESNILKNQLFSKKDNLLLAVSGGMDSVVLAFLLKKGGYNFSLAHCNFNLRGKDSLKDEKFCHELAEELGVKIFVTQPDVKKYCKENKASIQMAARDLRYTWFKKLLKEEKLDYLLTAHHANDLVETILINLLRGTGITGLKGIPQKNETTVRPLSIFSRGEIEGFAKKEKIKFRTDKSNFEDRYERNFLRLKVIPKLKKINPSLEQTFIKNSKRFSNEAAIVSDYIDQRIKELVTDKKGSLTISRTRLKKEKHPETFLHYWLSPLGFSETQQQNILTAVNNNSAETKQFLSPTHKLVISRDEILVVANKEKDFSEIKITSLKELKNQKHFGLTQEKKFVIPGKEELYLPEEKLLFPLLIRHPATGDKFKPFGMKGFKLLSDFIKDEKINAVDKSNLQLLVNGNGEIIWVIGYRSDERYRVNKEAKKFLKLKLK